MKLHRFISLAALLLSPAFAQTNTFPASGNVGIGTMYPNSRLHVGGSNSELVSLGTFFHDSSKALAGLKISETGGEKRGVLEFQTLHWNSNPYELTTDMTIIGGHVGIGTTNPRSRLDIGSNIGAGQGASFGDYFEINERELINNAVSLGWNAHIAANDGTYAPAWAGAGASGMVLAMDGGGTANLDFWGKQWASEEPASLGSFTHVMRLSTNGNVGIGTTNPQHKLAVNGTIKAKEVIVETTGWSDYVFADDYRLAPLSEVEAHIAEKKHLPGLPSTAEVTEHGINVAQVQAALLAKVEELTLHLIAQEKTLREIKAENQALRNEQGRLHAAMNLLRSLNTASER